MQELSRIGLSPEMVKTFAPHFLPFAAHDTLVGGAAGAFAGHTLALAFGKEAAFISTVALTAFGAHALETHPVQSALLAGTLYLAPSVARRVATEVLSKVILKGLALGGKATLGFAKAGFHVVTCYAFYGPTVQELEKANKKLKEINESLKQTIIAQEIKLQESAKKIAELEQKLAQTTPPPSEKPSLFGIYKFL